MSCAALGDVCEFHAGFAEGWDACAAFVARVVEDERAAELGVELGCVELGDVEGVV